MKRKRLSASHRRNISRARKGLSYRSSRQKPTFEGHILKGLRRGAKIGAVYGGGVGSIYGGMLAGPPGALIGGGVGAVNGAIGGGTTGSVIGTGIYGYRKSRSGRRR